MAQIDLIGLSKRYGAVAAVEGFDLTVDPGEFMVVLGPSGSGKTTVLRLVAGLEDADAGEVLIDGEAVDHVPPAKRNIAMVFQSYALYPAMSVQDNIGFPLRMQKRPAAEIEAMVRQAAGRLGLGDLLERRPRDLSGGQRQRVALARALVRQPRIFLMDEPLSNLDAALRIGTRAQIRQLARELGATVLYVTHDQVEAMTLADRVAVMRAGRIEQVGTPREIYERPVNAFVAGFIGTPPMNLMQGRLRGGVFRGQNVQIEGLGDGDGEVILGFRPEEAQVVEEDMGFTGCEIAARLYGLELTGEAALAVVEAGGVLVRARTGRDYAARIGDRIRIVVPPDVCHVFDATTGMRLSGLSPQPRAGTGTWQF